MARILVIDDDELLRMTVEAMLKSGGHDVVPAGDGERGLERFERQHFDLVLCDVFMPNKEGLETVREIRRRSADTPIISMTGSIAPVAGSADQLDPDFLRMAGAFGATATIAKPFTVRELLTLVEQCLATAAQRRGG